MARKRQPDFIKGTATHRRTEGDYMGTLLDTVTLDDWRDVVSATLNLAKAGDPAARAWLAQYLVGKPETKAPTPLTVVVQQLNGADPLIDQLARPYLERSRYPALHRGDGLEEDMKRLIAGELAQMLPATGATTNSTTAGDPGQSAD